MKIHCKDELSQKLSIKKSVIAVAVGKSISEMMWQLLRQQSAPDVDIGIFSGNPVDFHYFMAMFNEIVKRKKNDHRQNRSWKRNDKKLHSVAF